ncbi:MAG: RNB domain-containing ribonuclease [Rhodoferax sp.]|nr:RNB domain-containing ribonuclease [Rhodoferax sp.]
MYALFEEAGKLMAGRVLSEAEASAQVELDSGKRVKVKTSNMLLRFEKPVPAEFIAAAQAASQDIELELAWEFAPDEEFGFAELARDYFSVHAPASEQAAMLLRLFESPHYFRRAGKGRFRKASADVLAQALAAIEKKKAQALQISQWALELGAGTCPEPIKDQLYKILFKPDKNAPEYKAVVEASRNTQKAPLALLQQSSAIASPYQFHWKRFLLENFPKGAGFPSITTPLPGADFADFADLPLAEVQAFSIDDSATTEIDDALSVQGLGSGSGTVTLGIHIAAPGLALHPGDALDQLARARLSTVYMPGYKITMLPDALVQAYTLQAGVNCPALSLYVTLDAATLEVTASVSRLERVPIVHNLRHDQLDAIVTEAWLQDPGFTHENEPQPLPELRDKLSFLYKLALKLKAGREQVRGKPENFNRPDYNFKLLENQGAEPQGTETVRISVRQRGAPLDLIVAEAMILANSTWGGWLAELGVPGIYRSQASLAPGIKVRMSTKALPHAGIGVKSYAWSSSPLRRYVDLVNQWQIIACVKHGKAAALAAPFKPRDANLLAIISSFDEAYGAYNSYQSAMERFWTLQYLEQNGITELDATVFKESLARADTLPLVFPVMGAQNLPRAARVRVKLGAVDLITLDVHGTVLERLDTVAQDTLDVDDEQDEVAGPIAIAVDVNDMNELPEATSEPPIP